MESPTDSLAGPFALRAGVERLVSRCGPAPLRKDSPMDDRLRLVCDYMHYAFLPRRAAAEEKATSYRQILTDSAIETFDPADTGSARALAVRILRKRLAERGATRIKMGVTAGLDSRGLLGVALDVLAPENIIAYTTGQKGNRDIERARWFTQDILPTHHLIETQGGTYDAVEWVSQFRNRPVGFAGTLYGKSSFIDSPLPHYGALPTVVGYLGDALSGKRLHGRTHEDWDAAISAFVHKNEVFRPSTKRVLARLPHPDYDPRHMLPDAPLLPRALMSYDDQLDLCYRQHQRVRLNFKPYTAEEAGDHIEATNTNVNMITIYDDPRWQKSYLSLPTEERLGQKHYKRMLRECWPHIFKDLADPENPRYRDPPPPTDPKEKLRRSAETSLHTNWELLWTRNENFNAFARDLIKSLAARRFITWFDPHDVLDELDRDVLGLGKIIWCLCSVELNIRANRLPDPGA